MNRREDLANVEMGELEIIKTFIPKQPTDEELADYVTEVIKDYYQSRILFHLISILSISFGFFIRNLVFVFSY